MDGKKERKDIISDFHNLMKKKEQIFRNEGISGKQKKTMSEAVDKEMEEVYLPSMEKDIALLILYITYCIDTLHSLFNVLY